jgi:hypothetical protein
MTSTFLNKGCASHFEDVHTIQVEVFWVVTPEDGDSKTLRNVGYLTTSNGVPTQKTST